MEKLEQAFWPTQYILYKKEGDKENTCISARLWRKKHRKDRPEINEIGYLQQVSEKQWE